MNHIIRIKILEPENILEVNRATGEIFIQVSRSKDHDSKMVECESFATVAAFDTTPHDFSLAVDIVKRNVKNQIVWWRKLLNISKRGTITLEK